MAARNQHRGLPDWIRSSEKPVSAVLCNVAVANMIAARRSAATWRLGCIFSFPKKGRYAVFLMLLHSVPEVSHWPVGGFVVCLEFCTLGREVHIYLKNKSWNSSRSSDMASTCWISTSSICQRAYLRAGLLLSTSTFHSQIVHRGLSSCLFIQT